jgi:hypothetical protein
VITEEVQAELASRKGEVNSQNRDVQKLTNKGAIQKYDAAITKFNTARASIFKQESKTHARVRVAAQNLKRLREDMGAANPTSHFVKLKDVKDKKEFVKKWLDAASTLANEADNYIGKKNPYTFAGKDRKSGARNLKQLADNEIRICEGAIEKQSTKNRFDVGDVYLEIASDKFRNAMNIVTDHNNYQVPVEEKDGKSVEKQIKEQKELIRNAILDAVAASTSQKKLGADKTGTADGTGGYGWSQSSRTERYTGSCACWATGKGGIPIWRKLILNRLSSKKFIMSHAITIHLATRSKRKNGIMSGCGKQGSEFRH